MDLHSPRVFYPASAKVEEQSRKDLAATATNGDISRSVTRWQHPQKCHRAVTSGTFLPDIMEVNER